MTVAVQPGPANMNESLVLEVAESTGADHWRWVLKDAAGAFLADHTVALDPRAAEYEALRDLNGYLDRYAAPDRWLQDETRLIQEVGAWMGHALLGTIAEAILDYGTPATVRVVVPPAADHLLYLPLEAAHARGRPLALQHVSLVYEIAGEAAHVRLRPVGDMLRVLAVFSLPTNASPLALRRERHALKRLIHRIARTHRLGIELRVLQYGVTREAFGASIEEGDGWDVLHFSDHGLPASLVLEKRDGTADVVRSDHWVRCWSPPAAA